MKKNDQLMEDNMSTDRGLGITKPAKTGNSNKQKTIADKTQKGKKKI